MLEFCKVCVEPSNIPMFYNLFQERSCESCGEWLEYVFKYSHDKLLNSCGSYEVVHLLASIDHLDKESFN